jgi:hypothetical protein
MLSHPSGLSLETWMETNYIQLLASLSTEINSHIRLRWDDQGELFGII